MSLAAACSLPSELQIAVLPMHENHGLHTASYLAYMIEMQTWVLLLQLLIAVEQQCHDNCSGS